MESVCEYGGLRLDQAKPLADVSTGYSYFRDGDVVVAKITPCFENGKGSIAQGLTNGVGFGTTELHVLRPTPRLDPGFLFYLTISHPFRSMGAAFMYGAGGQKRVPDEFVRDFRQPIPPLDEQRAIAGFLDRETARIDALIEKKRRQIELLHEKRAALISHAVTKGLDPTARMKDSGIPGLGRIPLSWAFKRLKYLTPEITVGVVVTPSAYYVDEGIPFLRSLNIKEDEIVSSDTVFLSAESNLQLRKSRLKTGDLVSVRTGQPGTTAVIDERFDGANCIDLIITRRSDKLDSRFLCYAMNSAFSKSQYAAGSNGAIQAHFNVETTGNMLVPAPPHATQIAIREYLDESTMKLRGLMERVNASIDRLREYRAALISAAVTGKLDLRQEVA
ncbi:MAG: restriction endonuclease subunit S [Anaerosomatales bacterium]